MGQPGGALSGREGVWEAPPRSVSPALPAVPAHRSSGTPTLSATRARAHSFEHLLGHVLC